MKGRHVGLTDTHCFPGDQIVKSLPAMQETQVQSLEQDDSLEKEIAI